MTTKSLWLTACGLAFSMTCACSQAPQPQPALDTVEAPVPPPSRVECNQASDCIQRGSCAPPGTLPPECVPIKTYDQPHCIPDERPKVRVPGFSCECVKGVCYVGDVDRATEPGYVDHPPTKDRP